MELYASSRDCIARTREAAWIAVDNEDLGPRPCGLVRIALNDTSPLRSLSPRATPRQSESRSKSKSLSAFCRSPRIRPIPAVVGGRTAPSSSTASPSFSSKVVSGQRRHRVVTASSRRKNEEARVDFLRMMCMEAAQQQEDVRYSPHKTEAECQVMAAITRSHQALLGQYERAIEIRAVLDQEQTQWRHQSPANRGVNTSPKNSWSTSRKLDPVLGRKHTKNPPAFLSDDVNQCSLKHALQTSEKLAQIIDKLGSQADSEGLGRSVVKKLGFSSVDQKQEGENNSNIYK